MNLRADNPPLTPPRRGTFIARARCPVPLLGGVRGGSARPGNQGRIEVETDEGIVRWAFAALFSQA